MIRLSVDSERKHIEFEVLLKGQQEPLKVVANNYEVGGDETGRFVLLKDVETSWSWINVALRTFRLAERKVPLPNEYAELIELAL